jgi:hypothetical protein
MRPHGLRDAILTLACVRLETMSDPASDVNEAVCWQCRRPANPKSVLTKVLKAQAGEHKDGQGYPVVHCGSMDEVHVRIPRCRACQYRNEISTILVFAGGLFGALLCVVAWPSKGASITGAFLGSGTAYLGVSLCERPGVRPVGFYPPLRRLRRVGWTIHS